MSAVTQLDKPAEGSETGSGVRDFTPMHFQMTDLSMAQYDVLYQQGVQGHMMLQQVEEDHWHAVREMMELQKVAEEGVWSRSCGEGGVCSPGHIGLLFAWTA